jgi:uncharacterized protein YndB with AHSA1/START domain
MTNKTLISKDLSIKTLRVTRGFNAPVEKVWKAWTESSLLDKWWAPRPWQAVTKSMDFQPGGFWLYCMAGPNGEKAWCRVGFKTITPEESFTVDNSFCDDEGNIDKNFPVMHWLCEFSATDTGTKVEVTITFDADADIEKILTMGFEAGFTMALGNLDELLEE